MNNKNKNNQCYNRLIYKWRGNNIIGEQTNECKSCGNLIHTECTTDIKLCNTCSIDTTRTIPYSSDNTCGSDDSNNELMEADNTGSLCMNLLVLDPTLLRSRMSEFGRMLEAVANPRSPNLISKPDDDHQTKKATATTKKKDHHQR